MAAPDNNNEITISNAYEKGSTHNIAGHLRRTNEVIKRPATGLSAPQDLIVWTRAQLSREPPSFFPAG